MIHDEAEKWVRRSALEQAAFNVISISQWYDDAAIPFPWKCRVHDGIVSIIAADGAVLISDNSRDCDPAFWTAIIAALNALAEEANDGARQ